MILWTVSFFMYYKRLEGISFELPPILIQAITRYLTILCLFLGVSLKSVRLHKRVKIGSYQLASVSVSAISIHLSIYQK